MSQVYNYRVLSSEMKTKSTLVILLETETGKRSMVYEPGQYAAISFWRRGRPTPMRCFSITSSPTDQRKLQFAVRVDGAYTQTAAAALKPGSKVIIEGPFGNFTVDSKRDHSIVMLAAGIGITPFMSILRYMSQLQLTTRLVLIYGCHSQDDVAFLDELIQIQKVNPHLDMTLVVSSSETDRLQDVKSLKGHIDLALMDQVLSQSYNASTFFVCGPQAFMDGVSKLLQGSRGVEEENVITEGFTQGQRGPRSIKHSLPTQVYTLTGLSLVLGTATVTVNGVVHPIQYSGNNTSQLQGQASAANSRQDTINQNLAALQGNGSSGQPAVSGIGSSGSGASSSPAQASSVGVASSGGSGGNGSSVASPPTSSKSTPTPAPTPAPTPNPTPAPKPVMVAPALTLTAAATQITKGNSTALSWLINSNATAPVSCAASGGWSGSKATSGNQTVSPTSTTTYSLACSNSGGSTSKSVTINVIPACVSTPSNPC